MDFVALLVLLIPVLIITSIFFLVRKRNKVAGRVFLISGISFGLFVFGLWVMELSGLMIPSHFNQIQNTLVNHLEMPEDENQQKYLLAGLSNAAEGLSRYSSENPEDEEASIMAIQSIVDFVTDDDNYPAVSRQSSWKNNIFYLTHLNIILSSYRIATDTDSLVELNTKVNDFLANRLVRSKFKNLNSFKDDNTYWLSDNSLIIRGIELFDQASGTNKADRPGKEWISFIFKEILYNESNLPCTSFTQTNKCKEMPHGSHLATIVSSISKSAPKKADKIWREYKHLYKKSSIGIFGKFQQYHPDEVPPAYKRQADHPIEALSPQLASLKAAAYHNDRRTYYQLTNQMWLNEVFGSSSDKMLAPEYRWLDFLELSVRFAAETII